MKKFFYWFLAFVITICAAYYQRKTGPTCPKRVEAKVNGISFKLKMVRSLGLDERSQVKLAITYTSVKTKLYFRRFPTNEEYQTADFSYWVYPVDLYIINNQSNNC